MEFFRVTTTDEARELIRLMPEVVALDTEYVKGNPRTTILLAVIISDDTRAWVIDPPLLPMLTNAIRARKLIFLQDYNHCDTVILYKHGCDIRDCNVYNLIDMHHLIDENADHSLDARVKETFGDNYKEEFWKTYKNFEDASDDEQLQYAGKDGIYTYRLGLQDYVRINGNSSVNDLYLHVRKLSRALLDTELEGLCVNETLIHQTMADMSQKLAEYLPKLRKEHETLCKIWEFEKWQEKISTLKTVRGRDSAVAPVFSFESDAQLRWLLYEGFGIPVKHVTKKKSPKVDYDTLKELAEEYPEIRSIFVYKEVKTVYATFVKGMAERIENGKIYPHFNVSGTKTGRISHTDPNMGNLPKDGVIRNFFIPSPGMVIIGADYAQLEVVVELNLTEDPGLKEIVVGGKSKHDLFKEDLDKAGFDIPRSQVKNINFALQYGAGAFKISKMVGCSKYSSQEIIDTFYARFSGVKDLKDATTLVLKQHNQVTNLSGRTRRFPTPKNDYEKAKQERQAYNFLIQGVAGEACNRAYYRFHSMVQQRSWGRALFNVHDEIVAEVKTEYAEEAKALLIEVMEQSTQDFNFKYPLKAVAYGPMDKWAKT